jgi:cytochrome c oxidase subunit 4
MTDSTITSEAHGVAHDDHGDHPTEKQYWIVFVVLAVFTAVEVAWSYLGLSGPALVLPLVAMMVVKFVLVAGIFMHLKYDFSIRNGGLFTYLFAFGIAVAVAVYAVVLITFITR